MRNTVQEATGARRSAPDAISEGQGAGNPIDALSGPHIAAIKQAERRRKRGLRVFDATVTVPEIGKITQRIVKPTIDEARAKARRAHPNLVSLVVVEVHPEQIVHIATRRGVTSEQLHQINLLATLDAIPADRSITLKELSSITGSSVASLRKWSTTLAEQGLIERVRPGTNGVVVLQRREATR